jgi:predicted Rossmann fold nucleotide-binding protein DprA/Smf involved in DNA uptake
MGAKNKFKKILPPDFPSLLKEINDPPDELWIEGNFPAWPADRSKENKFLAVVGSRKFSRYGKEACEELRKGAGTQFDPYIVDIFLSEEFG